MKKQLKRQGQGQEQWWGGIQSQDHKSKIRKRSTSDRLTHQRTDTIDGLTDRLTNGPTKGLADPEEAY